MAFLLADEEQEIINLWSTDSIFHFFELVFRVVLSSSFLKILPYEVARGWVEGLNGHKVSVEGTAKYNVHILILIKMKKRNFI